MASELYVALSGQKVMEARLATVANNIANMNTAGFRAEVVDFDTVLSDYRADRVNFATVGGTHIDRAAGPVERTGNSLDVAIVGDGWFGIETPEGLAYTRDGRLTISPDGDLKTLTGYNIVDDGGAPIQVDPSAGPVVIGADGGIRQGGRDVGVLGLYNLAAEAKLTRFGDTALLSDRPGEPMDDAVKNGIRQGYREGSNVDAVTSLTELITVQRSFEQAATAIRDREDALQQAVRSLGAD